MHIYISSIFSGIFFTILFRYANSVARRRIAEHECRVEVKHLLTFHYLPVFARLNKKSHTVFFGNVHIHLTYFSSKSKLHIIYASSLQICTHRPPFNHHTASEMFLKSTKSFIQANFIRPIIIRIVNKFCRFNKSPISVFLCLEKRLILILKDVSP